MRLAHLRTLETCLMHFEVGMRQHVWLEGVAVFDACPVERVRKCATTVQCMRARFHSHGGAESSGRA